ncbi:hypothetical protein [Undibacterium sp.]|uniref:hypothetical protein n=1 Tax=Undibacterium sp. TaxID=1914977 RepID=UPI0025D53221|nr:hypothetical protein [Undibacterium sp.]
MTQLIEAQFLSDVADHKMIVIRDDDVHRHIRFHRPGTMCMHFDLITWPGYLCYTGDMGTYVFQRLLDMFEFFRTGREGKKRNGAKLAINLSYWGEKLQSVDSGDGYRKYSEEKFKANVMRWIEDRGLNGKLGHGLRDELESDVLSCAEYGRDEAYRAAANFKYNDKEIFTDFWEVDSDEYSHRFLWCCYALAWGVEQYDIAKLSVEVPV